MYHILVSYVSVVLESSILSIPMFVSDCKITTDSSSVQSSKRVIFLHPFLTTIGDSLHIHIID